MQNWNDLRFVLETVRHGGLSGAARALGVNHATVSRRIAAAEAQMGARLFDRLPGGYAPTEAGRDAARAAERMEAANDDLSRQIAARDQSLSGTLKVTAPQLMVERVIAPLLAGFRETHPQIELSIIATNDILSLTRRQADVAFRISDAPPETLVGVRATDQRAGVYASHALLEALAQTPDAPLDWIRFAHWPGPPKALTQAWPNRRIVMTVDDMIAAIGVVRAGLGATRMACFLGDTDPALGRLPGVPLFDYAPLWILTHPDLRKAPRVTAFMSFAAAHLRKMRPLFQGLMVPDPRP